LKKGITAVANINQKRMSASPIASPMRLNFTK